VFLKPIDPHAPRNRARTGAFEVQMCFHSRHTASHHKVLLFSKLQRGEFPDTNDLLHQLSELQATPPAGGTSSWDPFEPKTKVDFAFDPDSFATHGTNPFFDPDPEEEATDDPEYNEIMREEQAEMGRAEEQAEEQVRRLRPSGTRIAPRAGIHYVLYMLMHARAGKQQESFRRHSSVYLSD
jgi:hypothetical protein